MILRRKHRVLVMGLTGRQGTFWGRAMLEYGTRIVGGVNPRKAGSIHLGIPIFASATEAASQCPFDTALMFVPPLLAKDAAIDACEAGSKTVICLAEHIPAHDVMEMLAAARSTGSQIIGPNTSGLVTPGETFAGIMPAFNSDVFQPGGIGVISRSGSLGTLICLQLTANELGQSAFYGVGGDSIVGTRTLTALKFFETDERTQAIVICGEIGGSAEEEAAEYAGTMSKPVVAFIAGKTAPEGRKMGHAGAIVSGAGGGYGSKRKALEANGVAVADLTSQIPQLLREKLPHRPNAEAII